MPIRSRSAQNDSIRAVSSRHQSSSSSAAGWSAAIASRTPRTSAPSSSGRGRSGTQVGHRSCARRTISARTALYSRSAAAVIRSGREIGGPHRVAHLPGEQVGCPGAPRPRSPAGPRRAGGSRSRPWPPWRSPRRPQAGRDRDHGRVVGVRIGLPERVVDQPGDARQLLEGGLGLEPPDGPTVDTDERPWRRSRLRQAFEPTRHRRQPIAQWGELAGDQREQALADQVDPVERVPGVLAQLKFGEPHRVDLAEDQVAVDGLVGGQLGQALERGLPAVHGVQSSPRRPASVTSDQVPSDRWSPMAVAQTGIEPEQLVEERAEDVVERGHPLPDPHRLRSSRKSQPRMSPGSIRTTTPPWPSA